MYTAKTAPERIDFPPKNGDCLGHDPAIFFPHATKDGESDFSTEVRVANANTKMAKLICQDCKQIDHCFAYSIHHERYGIWAGLTERERMTVRRRLNIKTVQKDPMNIITGLSLR